MRQFLGLTDQRRAFGTLLYKMYTLVCTGSDCATLGVEFCRIDCWCWVVVSVLFGPVMLTTTSAHPLSLRTETLQQLSRHHLYPVSTRTHHDINVQKLQDSAKSKLDQQHSTSEAVQSVLSKQHETTKWFQVIHSSTALLVTWLPACITLPLSWYPNTAQHISQIRTKLGPDGDIQSGADLHYNRAATRVIYGYWSACVAH